MIKTELAEYNVSSGSLKDRRELEYALAVARVKKELKAKEEGNTKQEGYADYGGSRGNI